MSKKTSKVVATNLFDSTQPGIIGKRYDVRWDPEEGNIEIVQAGSLDFTPLVLLSNDTWSSITEYADQNIPGKDNLNYIPDVLATKEGKIEYAQKVANLIIKAQEANGGGKIPAWIEEYKNETDIIKKYEIAENLVNGVLNKGDAKKFGITEAQEGPISYTDLKKTDITLNTIKELMLDGPLKYPVDAIYSNRKTGYNQDHVRITQYTYKPPRPNLVRQEKYKAGDDTKNKEVKTSAWDIATKGASRSTPLESYLGMVRLPMPTDISDSNNVAWGQDQVNNFSAAMTAAVGGNLGATATSAALTGLTAKIFGGDGQQGAGAGVMIAALTKMGINLNDLQGASGQTARATIQSRLLAMAGVQISPESILARGLGVVPNSNMELLFNAPALREFAFSWKMTPRDEYEAKKVRHIIRFFKQGMAARKIKGTGGTAAGASSLYLGTPNVFHVQYKTNRDEDIEGVNRIKTCAVTGCAVNYTPDGVWSAYEEGQPVSTIMALRFQELEPIYDTDYQNKIVEGRVFNENPTYTDDQGDLYPIGINEVGY